MAQYSTFVNNASEAQEKLTKEVEHYNNAQKEQVKAQQQVISSITASNAKWRESASNFEDNIIQSEKYKNTLSNISKELKTTKNSLEEYTKFRARTKENVEETARLRSKITELNKEQLITKARLSEVNITLRNQTKEFIASDGSMTEMNQTLGAMRKLFKDLNAEQRDSDFGKNLQAQIQILDKELKELDASIGNHQRKVGDYEGGFKKAFEGIRGSFDSLLSGDIKGALSQFSEGIDGITQTVTYLTPAIKTATTATSAETASLLLNSTASSTAATASTALAGANAVETASSNAVTAATTAETAALEANVVATGQAGAASGAAAGGGMKALLGSIKALTIASLKFIATPIGAALMALVGIAAATKAVWDYNSSIQESLTLTKQLTGLSGSAADNIRTQAQALSDTYGNEFQENLRAAKKLVDVFKISYDEAFSTLDKGLATGGIINEEFFNSINEFPVFFQKAGYSASQFIDTINTGVDLSLYQDKLPDAIKEFQIALEEQTPSTRDALVNAFGQPFADDLLKRVRTGATSTKEALEEIANKSRETNMTLQQEATLTADLLGKSMGEDLGGAEKVFEALRHAAERANRPLTDTEQHLMNLYKANKDLEVAMEDALKVDGVINLKSEMELLWINIQTGFFKALKPLRELGQRIWDLTGRSESLNSIWNNIQKIGSIIFRTIENLQNTFGRLAEKFGATNKETSEFYRVIGVLFDPIVQLEAALNILVEAIDFIAKGFENSILFAEAFGRTIGDIYNGLKSLDFSALSNIGGLFVRNTALIQAENNVRAENAKKAKMQAEANKALAKSIDDISKAIDVEMRSRTESDIEAKKRAEEEAKRRAELQKQYAAEQKKRQEEAKRLAEEAFREEVARNQALIDHYKLTNESKLNFDKSFTLQSIFDLRKYLDNVFDMEKKQAERVAGIKYEDALNTDIKDRTSQQQNLINQIIGLEQWRADEIKGIEDGLAKWRSDEDGKALEREKKRLSIDFAYNLLNTNDKKKAEREYQDAIFAIDLETFEKKTKLTQDEVMQKYESGVQMTSDELDYVSKIIEVRDVAHKRVIEDLDEQKKAKQKALEEDFERTEYWLEYLGESLGAESQMREILNAYKATLDQDDLKSKEDKAIAELNLAAAIANAGAQIAGEQSVFGKALAVTSAAINTAVGITKALVDPGGFAGIALSVAIGALGAFQIAKIVSSQPPAPPKFSATPQFEHGVTNSTYEGLAIKDEAGAEIHLDKSGNVKDWGSNSGAKNFHIKKGDTVLPNPISERIKDLMSHNPMPDLMMSLNLNGLLKQNNYDFERLEKKFDKLERAITRKPNKSYLDTGDNLIEVTEINGNTHQRFIPKAGNNIKQQPSL